MPTIPETLRSSPWMDKTVTILHEDGVAQSEVEAKAFGAFAVHKAVDEDIVGEFTLTHVPTGMAVLHLPDEQELMAAGEWLWSKLCMTFRLKDQQEIKDKTVGWAKPWRDECMATGKFLVPNLT